MPLTPPTPTSSSPWPPTCCSRATSTAARRYAQELVRMAPDYPNARELLRAVDPNAG